MLLFVDTETTGLPDFKKSFKEPCQPHIASIGFVGYDEVTHQETVSAHVLIRPDGWIHDPESKATKTHLITTEMAQEFGIPIRVAINFLEHHWWKARRVIMFNARFDSALIEIERARLGRKEYMDQTKLRCAMIEMAGIMKLPSKVSWSSDYAYPKLEAAYEWCYQQKMADAHNALADARATAFITFALHGWKMGSRLYEEGDTSRKPVEHPSGVISPQARFLIGENKMAPDACATASDAEDDDLPM